MPVITYSALGVPTRDADLEYEVGCNRVRARSAIRTAPKVIAASTGQLEKLLTLFRLAETHSPVFLQ